MVSFLGWVYPNNDVKVTENKIAFTESGKGKLMPFGEVKFLGRLVKEFGTDKPLVSDSYGAYTLMAKVESGRGRFLPTAFRVFVHPDLDDYLCNGYIYKDDTKIKGYIVHPDDEEANKEALEKTSQYING